MERWAVVFEDMYETLLQMHPYRSAAPRLVPALRLLDFLAAHAPWAALVIWG